MLFPHNNIPPYTRSPLYVTSFFLLLKELYQFGHNIIGKIHLQPFYIRIGIKVLFVLFEIVLANALLLL